MPPNKVCRSHALAFSGSTDESGPWDGVSPVLQNKIVVPLFEIQIQVRN